MSFRLLGLVGAPLVGLSDNLFFQYAVEGGPLVKFCRTM